MKNLFEGRIVRLRCYEPEDIDKLYEDFQRNSEIGRRSFEVEWPLSKAQMLRNIEQGSTSIPETDNRPLAIETIKRRLVGGVAVYNTNRKNGTFDIGISISDEREWGKGYAKEAMLLMIRYMFHELRYQKCNIGIKAFNERAIKFHRKLGFRDEGRRRFDYFSNGQFHDTVLMGLTRVEYDTKWPAWTVKL